MKTLLVEDDTGSRIMLESVLRLQKHDVSSFAAAEPALDACRTAPFDVALLDWVLPGMSGLDLCREIRAQEGGESTYILMLTGCDRDTEVRLALEAGADDLLIKPIDPQALLSRLKNRPPPVVIPRRLSRAQPVNPARKRAIIEAFTA